MNQPKLYQKAHPVQRRDAKEVLEEFGHLIHWGPNDTLLDIGCGTGDVMMEYVYPQMPVKFKRLVGSDISEQMIRYARNTYKDFSNVSFEILDVGGDVDRFVKANEKFDHITSFYCLHWVQNQKCVKLCSFEFMFNGFCISKFQIIIL